MKTLPLLIFAAVLAFADDKPKFEVKTISADAVKAMSAADAEVEAAAKALAEAADKLATAKVALSKATREAIGNDAGFEGECKTPPQPTAGNITLSVYVIPYREFRRVEIKGKYLLISRGQESCGAAWGLTSGVGTALAPVTGYTIESVTPDRGVKMWSGSKPNTK